MTALLFSECADSKAASWSTADPQKLELVGVFQFNNLLITPWIRDLVVIAPPHAVDGLVFFSLRF
jgi:hypothetical protein